MKNISEQTKKDLINLISAEQNCVIIGHHNPDGDAVGGSLALYQLFKNTGMDVSVIMPTDTAGFLKWLPNYDKIFIYQDHQEKCKKLLHDADIIFCIDFNNSDRVEAAKESLVNSKAVKIMIDHHPDPVKDADFIFSYTEKSSASEIVYEFIKLIGLGSYIDKNIATCIFTGIMTDTLNFSVNSSRTETFKIVSELLTYGIEKDKIYNEVNNNFSVDRLRLVGFLMYKKLKIIDSCDVAYMILSKDEMKAFNFKNGDHEGIVNMPLSVSTIIASVIAIEKDDHIKVSLRSKDDIDVNLLSQKYFHGGGHKNAAGGKIYTHVDKAEEYIINSINEFLNKSV